MQAPGERIRDLLAEKEWTQEDLAKILDRPRPTIAMIINGKKSITPEMARDLGVAFGNGGEYWSRLEADYRRWLASDKPPTDIERRKRVYELAPIKEMIKRGWINDPDSDAALEKEVMRFYSLNDISENPSLHGAMRKSGSDPFASPAQMAWGYRVRQLAAAIPQTSIEKFDESRLDDCMTELRKIAAYSSEVRKVPALLASYGIRFVAVEGLQGAKMDGFATWLDEDFELYPVIGMSLKRDKLDSFWFTLGHEVIHIKNKDVAPIDGSVGDQDDLLDVKPQMERVADEGSAAMFIRPDDLESFVLRVHPMYSIERINQFANSIRMHPSIVIGQLKHRGKIGYSKFTKPAYPVREAVSKAAVADGWGKVIFPGALA